MLVRFVLVLLGLLGAILADPNRNGDSSPTRRTPVTREVEGKALYRQRTGTTDGTASPRRNLPRQKFSSNAEFEETQRLAYLHRPRNFGEGQVQRSGTTSPKRRSEEDDTRRLVHVERVRSAFHSSSLRNGSASPSRKSFSDVESEVSRRQAAFQRQQLELEAQKQAALKKEALELEVRRQAQKEALELEAWKKAQRDTLELEARKKAESEASELEARKRAERQASELEARKKAEREALELEARKQAQREALELEAQRQAVLEKERLQLEEEQKKASLQKEQTQTHGYASDTDPIKRSQSLTTLPSLSRQDSLNRRKGRFLDFSTPKVFQTVCDYEKVKSNDPKRNEACHKQCIELSNQIDDIYKNYPHMVKIKTLHSECSGFSQGSCKIAYDFKGKKTAACTCLGWTDEERANFKSQYAAVCRASLSGLKVVTNLSVATEGVRKGVKKMFQKWRNRSNKSKGS